MLVGVVCVGVSGRKSILHVFRFNVTLIPICLWQYFGEEHIPLKQRVHMQTHLTHGGASAAPLFGSPAASAAPAGNDEDIFSFLSPQGKGTGGAHDNPSSSGNSYGGVLSSLTGAIPNVQQTAATSDGATAAAEFRDTVLFLVHQQGQRHGDLVSLVRSLASEVSSLRAEVREANSTAHVNNSGDSGAAHQRAVVGDGGSAAHPVSALGFSGSYAATQKGWADGYRGAAATATTAVAPLSPFSTSASSAHFSRPTTAAASSSAGLSSSSPSKYSLADRQRGAFGGAAGMAPMAMMGMHSSQHDREEALFAAQRRIADLEAQVASLRRSVQQKDEAIRRLTDSSVASLMNATAAFSPSRKPLQQTSPK